MTRYWVLRSPSLAKRSTGQRSSLAQRGGREGRVEVRWENPRGPRQGVSIRRYMGGDVLVRRVGPSDFLSMAEAAEVLGTYRMKVYRLAKAGELKTRTVWGITVVTLSEIKRFMARSA